MSERVSFVKLKPRLLVPWWKNVTVKVSLLPLAVLNQKIVKL